MLGDSLVLFLGSENHSLQVRTFLSQNSSEKKSGFSAEVSVNGESQWSSRKQFGDKKTKSTVVFVLNDDNTVEQRIVETGIVGDRDYEVISGLEVDEKIVTGSFIAISRELFDGAVVTVKENSRPNRKRD